MSQRQFGFTEVVDTWLWAPTTPTESCELASHLIQYVYITTFLLVGIYSMGLKPENRLSKKSISLLQKCILIFFWCMWVCHNMYWTNYVGDLWLAYCGKPEQAPHLRDYIVHVHVYVCLLACLLVAIYRKFKLNKRMFKFAHMLKQIHVQWTNSMPMDLLKTTADNDRQG